MVSTIKDYWNDTFLLDSNDDLLGKSSKPPTLLSVANYGKADDSDASGDANATDAVAVKLGATHGLVLDRTLFHPQGGGQPSDVGKLLLPTSEEQQHHAYFEVLFVRYSPAAPPGVQLVEHLGRVVIGDNTETAASQQLLKEGSVLRCVVDGTTRRLHARLHSAGHLIDVAVRQAGFRHLEPTKGCHFVDNAYVEYAGMIDASERTGAAAKIQEACDALIQVDADVSAQVVPYDQIGELCGETPAYLPKGEEARVVRMKLPDASQADNLSPGCPCGGTHVQKVAQIEKVSVKKVTCRKGVTRVSYACE